MSISSKGRAQQRGDVLLEALIGVLITAIIGAGMLHVSARIVNNQHDTAVDALVVNELRNVMQLSGVDLCVNQAPLTEKKGLPSALETEISLEVETCATAQSENVEIGGVSFAGIMPPVVSVNASKGDTPLLMVSSVVSASEAVQ